MELSPMRFKDYIWPHNPRIYTIDYERVMAENKVPFGLYHLQDLGRKQRVMRGEGEFAGPEAYSQFGALANVFYSNGPGLLIHPLWQTASAYFVELALRQEPRPDYVAYTFAFWEDLAYYDAELKQVAGTAREAEEADAASGLIHTVVQGDTLWAIALHYGVTVDKLIRNNPQIKNPNLIRVGQEVRIR